MTETPILGDTGISHFTRAKRPSSEGKTISVRRGEPVEARITVGNLGDAEWVPPDLTQGQAGGVCLSSAPGSKILCRVPIAEQAPRLGEVTWKRIRLSPGVQEETPVILQRVAEGRGAFGEKRSFTLSPM